MLCVVVMKLIRTKTVLTKKNEIQNVQIVGDLMSPTTKAVLLPRIKPSGNMHSPFHGFWQSFVTIGWCNHLIRIISRYVGNTKKSKIS